MPDWLWLELPQVCQQEDWAFPPQAQAAGQQELALVLALLEVALLPRVLESLVVLRLVLVLEQEWQAVLPQLARLVSFPRAF